MLDIDIGTHKVKLKDARFYQEAWGEGREDEGRNLLKRILLKRFGELPENLQQQLEKANIEQIEKWADGLFDAPSLEAIFKKTIH